MEMQQIIFRLADDLARRFRSALALDNITQQEFLTKTVVEYVDRKEKKAA